MEEDFSLKGMHCTLCGSHEHHTKHHHEHGKHIGHEMMERGENSIHGYFENEHIENKYGDVNVFNKHGENIRTYNKRTGKEKSIFDF